MEAAGLRLRRLALSDREALAALAYNEKFIFYICHFPSPYTLADATAWTRKTGAVLVPLNFGA